MDETKRLIPAQAGTLSAVTAIVPTIGRPNSLRRLLASLAAQSIRPDEVIVVDASDSDETQSIAADARWGREGLAIRHLRHHPANVVHQRKAAIEASQGAYLLFLDDDVELEPNCVEQLLKAMNSDEQIVAAVADFSNEPWSGPTRPWRAYMRWVLGLDEDAWQGRVVGPLLRFGFPSMRGTSASMDWIGAGNALVSRQAYVSVGGFSDFFSDPTGLNEDVDLGLKLSRTGKIIFWPAAKLAHYHEPAGRVGLRQAAETDVFNRYQVLRHTLAYTRWRCLRLIALYVAVETASDAYGLIRSRRTQEDLARIPGRLAGLARALGLWKRSPTHRV